MQTQPITNLAKTYSMAACFNAVSHNLSHQFDFEILCSHRLKSAFSESQRLSKMIWYKEVGLCIQTCPMSNLILEFDIMH